MGPVKASRKSLGEIVEPANLIWKLKRENRADRAQTEPTQEQKTPLCFDSQELMKMMMKELFQRKEEDRKWEKEEKPDSA